MELISLVIGGVAGILLGKKAGDKIDKHCEEKEQEMKDLKERVENLEKERK